MVEIYIGSGIIVIVFLILQMVVLATEWDVSTATYTGEGSVASETSNPSGANISSDGSLIYLCGITQVDVFEYDLNTPWVASSIDSSDERSFDLSNEDASNGYGIFVKPDGTKFYTSSFYGSIWQYSMDAWDLSTAAYDNKSFNPDEITDPARFFFKPDGLKVYILDLLTDDVFQYSLSPAWDISSANYDTKTFDFTAKDDIMVGLWIKPDGTKIYMIGSQNDKVYQYTLTTPWDISSANDDSKECDISAKEGHPAGLFFKSDGTEFYYAGPDGNSIDQWSMPLAEEEKKANVIFFGTNF